MAERLRLAWWWFYSFILSACALALALPAQAATFNGTVFEDINYGGGAGRNYATANASAVASGFANNQIQVPVGVRVEIYNVNTATGIATFNTVTVTNAAGAYQFTGAGFGAGTYAIRVVNAGATGVRSKRPGGPCATCIPVQTFRVASAGAGVDNAIADVTNEVGGRRPQAVDGPVANIGFTFNVSTGLSVAGFPAGTTIQTYTTIQISGAAVIVNNLNFGFNYSTIVNTLDSGQGSLRQFIANSNTLTNANLAQQGQIAGRETSIFMIPNGQANPGQNPRYVNQLTVGGANNGAAVINLTSNLAIATDPNTRVDGSTQTANVRATPGGAETNPGTVGTGGSVGALNALLPPFNRPEVVVSGNGTDRRITTNVAGAYIGGIAWDQVGILTTGNTSTVQDNLVGMRGDGTVGTAYGANYGIQADTGSGITIRHNYVRVNNSGIRTDGGTTGLVIEQNEVANPGSLALPGAGHTLTFDGILLINNAASPIVRYNLAYNQRGGGFEYGFGSCGLFTNVVVFENTFRDNGFAGSTTVASPESMGAAIYCAGAGSNGVMSYNVIANNAGPGLILMQAANYVLSRNSFYGNGRATSTTRGLGIDSVLGRNTPNPLGTSNDGNRDPNNFCTAGGDCASAYVTLNDYGDAVPAGTVGGAAGVPNPLVNFPVIEKASISGGLLTIQGWARPGSQIEFFIAASNASGFGEGQTFIAALSEGSPSDSDNTASLYGAASDAACNVGAGATPAWTPVNGLIVGCDNTNRFRFTISVPPGVGIGVPLTSTATLNGTTSEFSNSVVVGLLDGQIGGRVFRDTGRLAGTANNGILDAGEEGSSPGIADVTVRLTNCVASGGGRIVYQTGTTDAVGSYVFAIPNPLGAVTELCVEETNLAATPVSTGASFVGTSGAPVSALPSGVSTAVLGTTYRYCRTTGDGTCGTQPADSIRIAAPVQGGQYLNLNFGDVPDNTWVADALQETTPGSAVNFAHRFTARSGGSVTFGATVIATTPAYTGWSSVLYRDTDCDGVIDAGEPLLAGAFTVTTGQEFCIVVRHFTPPSAPFNAAQAIRVDATFTWTNTAAGGPALIASYSRTDRTIVSDKDGSGLRLVKDVCNVTAQAAAGQPCDATLVNNSSLAANGYFSVSNSGQPGHTLRYRVIYLNPASTQITNVIINDATPPFTTYVASACVAPLPASISACTPATVPAVCAGTCALSWTLAGALNPGSQGIVTFDVLITP